MVEGGGGGGAGNIIGKVANDFGTQLNRDLDLDGDNDSAVVLNNIAGGNDDDVGYSLTLDSTGKIYVTGWSCNGSNVDMYVIRLNSDGSIDNSFGVNGKVVVNNIAGGNNWDVGYSLTLDSTGKIYVTGWSYNGNNDDMYVIRLNSDGSIDNSFGVNGKVVVNNIAGGNGYEYGRSLTLDSTGKIYVTGYGSNGSNCDMYVIRLNSDGSIDNSFGVNGKVVVNNIAGGNGDDVGYSLTLDSTGKIYVTGRSWNGSNWDMYVIRLNSDGSIDNSFGVNGKVVVNNIAGGNRDDYGYSLTIDSTGKIYVTGSSWNGSNGDMYVIRLNSDGSIDNSFGVNGKVVVNNIAGGNRDDVGYSLKIDSTGKIYVTGSSWNGSNYDMYVIKIE